MLMLVDMVIAVLGVVMTMTMVTVMMLKTTRTRTTTITRLTFMPVDDNNNKVSLMTGLKQGLRLLSILCKCSAAVCNGALGFCGSDSLLCSKAFATGNPGFQAVHGHGVVPSCCPRQLWSVEVAVDEVPHAGARLACNVPEDLATNLAPHRPARVAPDVRPVVGTST